MDGVSCKGTSSCKTLDLNCQTQKSKFQLASMSMPYQVIYKERRGVIFF